MRATLFLSLATVLCLAGCGGPKVVTTGPNGETVTQDASGNMTIDDGKGTKTEIQTGKDGWSAKSSDGTEVKIDGGSITTTNNKGETSSVGGSTVSESELGIDFYPGSKETSGKDMKIDADGKLTYLSNRTTTDSPEKVAEFYKAKVKGAATTSAGSMSTVSGKLDSGAEIMVMAINKDGETSVQISTSKKK